MTMEWKDIAGAVGKAAPILGTLVGGPAGGAIGGLIASALGTANTPDDVAEALKDPAALVHLRELQTAKETRLAELLADQAKLEVQTAAADRDSARKREAATGDTLTPRMLAFGVTAGFFGALAWLLYAGKPQTGGDALLVMLGSLGTAWAAIIGYYFGSSASSQAKNELLAAKK